MSSTCQERCCDEDPKIVSLRDGESVVSEYQVPVVTRIFVSFDKARSRAARSIRIFTAPTDLSADCNRVVLPGFLPARRDTTRRSCYRMRTRYRRESKAGEEVLCRRTTTLAKSLLSRRPSSLLFLLPFACPFVVLQPFLFLRPWPMNADPLMRADPAGLTRPDGCSWNPGTPLGSGRATRKIAV